MLIGRRNAMLAGSKLSAKSYVQDGLVAMWDGIENAGWGVHDANATVWKDLVGENNINIGSYHFEQDYLLIKGSLRYMLKQRVVSESTCEVVLRLEGYKGAANDNYLIFYYPQKGLWRRPNYIEFRNGNSRYGRITDEDFFTVSHFSFSENGSKKVGFAKNGRYLATNNYNTYGGAANDVDRIEILTSGFPLSIKSIRYYNRKLTADEIAHNYAVDKARFNLPDAT